MSQSDDIHTVELSIEEARKIVARGEAARRLSKNKDFELLVLEGYFVEELARLAHLFTNPNEDPEIRNAAGNDLVGPSAFKRYLSTLVQMGYTAENEIHEYSETLDELRAEEYMLSDDGDNA